MMKISAWLRAVSKGWLVLLALVIFLGFMIFILPGQSQKAEENSGGSGSPDTSLFYTPQTLYAFADAYGPVGRQAYIRARLTFDVIWPLSYAFFLTTNLSWLFSRGFKPQSPWQLANLIPLAGLVFDYGENLASVIVMSQYPAKAVLAGWLAVIFTPLKWLFVGSSFLCLVLGGVAVVLVNLKKQTREHH